MSLLDGLFKRKIATSKKQPDFASLATASTDENDDVREGAARKLGDLGDPRAVPVLIPLIKDKDWTVRTAVVTALEKIGTVETIPPLIDILKDEDEDISKMAASALQRIGGQEAQKALQRHFKDREIKQRLMNDVLKRGLLCLNKGTSTFEGWYEEFFDSFGADRANAEILYAPYISNNIYIQAVEMLKNSKIVSASKQRNEMLPQTQSSKSKSKGARLKSFIAAHSSSIIFVGVRIIATILLFWALADHDDDYYTILRWFICSTGLFTAFLAYKLRKVGWVWVLVPVALLFNPLKPTSLDEGTWQVIDVLTGFLFIASLFAINERRFDKKSNKISDNER